MKNGCILWQRRSIKRRLFIHNDCAGLIFLTFVSRHCKGQRCVSVVLYRKMRTEHTTKKEGVLKNGFLRGPIFTDSRRGLNNWVCCCNTHTKHKRQWCPSKAPFSCLFKQTLCVPRGPHFLCPVSSCRDTHKSRTQKVFPLTYSKKALNHRR